MKGIAAGAITGAILAALLVEGAPGKRDVDTLYPYVGPAVPVGDFVDPTVRTSELSKVDSNKQQVNGNGKGYPRLVEPPAVKPSSANPTNNINVISLSYVPTGVNIHFQTPFGLGTAPGIKWGSSSTNLSQTATGSSTSYDRTPPCSAFSAITQCSQYFHDVQLKQLKAGTTYYYQIQAANGTTASDVLTFSTARAAGDTAEFSIAVLNDMGYTNAHGTYKYLNQAVQDGAAFAWHGGDISYADDWYSGILPCESSWPVCYNGSSTQLPGGPPYPDEYINTPLPAGEVPTQGGPQGGDMNVIYESNWDLWQQWLNNVTLKVPYMTLPGNHEATCAEFDGDNNTLTAYLVDNKPNSTAPKSALTYYSCPPSQRNYTAYQHRFRMPGAETGGVGNFWYSFDYGLAHFISLDGETDFPYSPESPFVRDLKNGENYPLANETHSTDSGPFGYINGSWKDNKSYQQLAWLAKDLAAIDRKKTPWVFAMSHRPMYSSQVSSYQANLRNAFEGMLVKAGVDAYFAGHIHWYERLYPQLINNTGTDTASVVNNNTYYTNPGKSMTHLVNGMAGNIESHSQLSAKQGVLNITAVLDTRNYGFSKLTIHNATAVTWQFIRGADGQAGDTLNLLKKPS